MNESDLERVYNYNLYPRDSLITTNKGFVILDNRQLRGTHWCAFHVKKINHITLTPSVVSQINF